MQDLPQKNLQKYWFGATFSFMELAFYRFESVSSTMDTARSLIQQGVTSPAAVVARYQTNGRGRIAGRTWEAKPGSSLLTTIMLPVSQVPAEALSLKTGLALALALEELASAQGSAGSRFLLKWPNDILGSLNPADPDSFRKMAGILIEQSGRWFLIGAGLNLKKGAFPEALENTAVSLEEILGPLPLPDQEETLIQRTYENILAASASDKWETAYISRMWKRGMSVQFTEGHPEQGRVLQGILEGIDRAGQILIRLTDGSLRSYSSGEISLVRSSAQ